MVDWGSCSQVSTNVQGVERDALEAIVLLEGMLRLADGRLSAMMREEQAVSVVRVERRRSFPLFL